MNNNQLFQSQSLSIFLFDLGLFKDQIDQKKFENQNKTEQEALQFISQYIKTLRREQCNNLAKYLINQWKQLQTFEGISPISKSLLTEKKNSNKGNPDDNQKTQQKQDTIILKQINNDENVEQGQSQQKQNEEKSKVQVYQKLYNLAFEKNEQQIIRKDLQVQNELKNCTFQPEVNNQQSGSKNKNLKTPVFDRLTQKNLNKISNSVMKQEKENAELQLCTFQPQTNNVYNIDNYRFQKHRLSMPAFQRLYNDSNIQQYKFELMKEDSKKRYNFQPSINKNKNYDKKPTISVDNFIDTFSKKRPKSDRNSSSPVYERLYQDFASQKKHLIEKEIEVYWDEVKGCPFKPEICRQSKNMSQDIGIPRYEKLYKQALQLENKLNEKQLNKLIEEAKQLKSPQINQTSAKLNRSNSAFDRLYQDQQRKAQKIDQLTQKYMNDLGCTFKPLINNKKNQNQSAYIDQQQNKNQSQSALNLYQHLNQPYSVEQIKNQQQLLQLQYQSEDYNNKINPQSYQKSNGNGIICQQQNEDDNII